MDFELTDDQVALQAGVRDLCEGRFPMEVVRGTEDTGGVDAGRWRELADLGLFSLRLAEADGGVGLGWAEAVLAFEELGRALVPGPLVWTHLAAGLVDGAADGTRLVGGIERADPSGLIEHPEVIHVLAVLDDDGVALVDVAELDLEPLLPLDPLTPVSRVVGDLPAGQRVAGPDEARRWRRGGAALVAGQLLGIAQAATADAVAFSTEREQFGRPIGSFQALKHLMADMVVRTEVARGAVYAAGVTPDDPVVGSVDRAVTAAKLTAAEAAVANGATSVQVHGGMGYTWEIDAHLQLKRAYALEPLFGSRDELAERMADLLDVAAATG